MDANKIKETVRRHYGAAAKQADSNTSCCSPSCCSGDLSAADISGKLGYSSAEMAQVPEGSNLGLGCGNPTALATINPGDTVLDLGSGAGFDSFLMAQKVGGTGKVIGVDMTPEMLAKARANAQKGGFDNVEFREGEIEALPVDDNTVDLVISNCVINLSPDKPQVFREAFRVLKPGGRICVSDIVLLDTLPDVLVESAAAYSGCVAGALLKQEYLEAITAAGFEAVTVVEETAFPLEYITGASAGLMQEIMAKDPRYTEAMLRDAVSAVRSIKVQAEKPSAQA